MATQQLGGTSTPTNLSNPVRVITTTNLDTAVSTFDKSFDESLGVLNNLGGALFRLGYVSEPPPQVLNGSDLASYADYQKNVPPLVIPGGGAMVWYVDTPPGAGSPLHRTVSLDFVIVVEGQVELTLDSGERRLLNPGDLVIQRGTTHKWKNPSPNKWTRMVGVMAAAEPIALNNGTLLGEYFPSKES